MTDATGLEAPPDPDDAPALVDVVFPCLNEAGALPDLLRRVPAGFRAIVADNGSDDGSPEIARDLGATVVHQPRRGFGAACHTGLLAATADLVAFCDADGSLDPAQLPTVVDPVLDGRADLVLGRRRASDRRAWPLHARLANVVLAGWIRRHTGVVIGDLGPMRAMRRKALVDLQITDRRFGYPLEMVLRAAQRGWRVQEVDVDYRPRIGKSKVTGTVRGTVRAIADMRRVMGTVRDR